MKKIFTLVSLLLAFMQGNALDYSNPATNDYIQEWGRLKLVGNQLSSESGQPVQLRGWSTFGYESFSHCFDDQTDFHKMKTYGANFARIAQYVNEFGGVKIDWVKNCIDYTAAEGMYCLVDWHILKPGNPNSGDYNGYGDFFRQITSYVKDKNYKHVIYEICNEPNDNVEGAPADFDYVWEWIKTYANKVLPIIAEKDANAIVVVGTPQWDQDVTRAFQDPITLTEQTKNLQLMYSFHHYAADQQRYLGILSGAAAFVPVFISEWGLSSHTGDAGCDTIAGNHMLLVANGQNLGGQLISWANWSWGDKQETSATWQPNWSDRNDYKEMTASGSYIARKLKKGDNFSYPQTTPYQSAQVFDGVNDFILDLGAYDKGGQDNAYFDYDEDWACSSNDKNNQSPCNAGDAGKDGFRPGEYFDIGYTDKNNKESSYKALGYIGNGEWVTYTIDVKIPGDYDFETYTCNHPDYNTFGIAINGKPGLVTSTGEATRFQALYLPPCKGGKEKDYDTWGWMTPYSQYSEGTKFRVHFEKAGEQKISFAFLTSTSGLGSFKIKGNPDNATELKLINKENVSIYPNPAENGTFSLTSGMDTKVKVMNTQGVCVYEDVVEADKEKQISLNVPSGIYFVVTENSKSAKTQKIIIKNTIR